jgi:hypothetical protein
MTPVKVKPPTEAFEHKRLLMYLEQGERQKRWVFSHIASESSSKSQRIKNARNGLKKGLPDFIVCTPTRVLWIELKRRRGGRTSPEQKIWIAALNAAGTPAAVCLGFDEAKAFLEKHEKHI